MQNTAKQSDFGSVIVDPATGECRFALPITVETIAIGTRGSAKRARRADPLARIEGLTAGMRAAAAIYRQAVEHTAAGRAMGPMPWAADRVMHSRSGVALLAQERALSAATWVRRGVEAMGLQAAHGVVEWVVICGWSVRSFENNAGITHGAGTRRLLVALEALAEAYEVA